jgi:hypothetical protein
MWNNTDYNSTYPQSGYGGPAALSPRIMLEYADAALQIDPQPPQGLNPTLTQRIVIEYADYASWIAFPLQRYHARADINGDGIVDIYDAILLAKAFDSVSGQPNWNPYADINGDNIVDIYDAIILASNFGKTA